jgi:hypothetical protein
VAPAQVVPSVTNVGGAPTQRAVTTVTIDPRTGSPVGSSAQTQAQAMAVSSSKASGAISNPVLLHAGITNWLNNTQNSGLAGSVQLPRSVTPTGARTAADQAAYAYSYANFLNTTFNDPPHSADGSIVPWKDQGRLSPGEALGFAGGSPGNRYYPSPPHTPPVAYDMEPGVHGVPVHPPQPIFDPIRGDYHTPPASPIQQAAQDHVPQAAPAPVAVYAGTNGYTYVGNPSTGYTKIGQTNPTLTPAQVYTQAAQPAPQPGIVAVTGTVIPYADTGHSSPSSANYAANPTTNPGYGTAMANITAGW